MIERLKAEADKIAGCMHGICRECMHCLREVRLSAGADFPAVLSLYSRYLVNKRLGKDIRRFADRYSEIGEHAERCIECGECLPWCEYKLDIPAMIRSAREELGPSVLSM